MFGALGVIGALIALFILAVIGFVIYLIVARAWIKVARADEALIISGKSQKDADGTVHATTVVVNGKALVNPINQRHEVISLRSRQVNMKSEAQSSDNVTLAVEAVALVKIGSSPEHVRRAAERFASQDKAIENFTQDQLEGSLRGVIAQQSVVSLMRERKSFSEDIATSITPELEKQGLILDSFQIRGITDGVGYIQSLGAPEIEAKRQAAEISQTNAERAIAKERITNEEANLVEQTALDTNTANATSEVGRARAEAEQAEALAGEKARQQVLLQQAENRQAQLDADVKRVADAERYRREQETEAMAFEQTRQAQARAEIAKADAQAVEVRAEAEANAIRLAGQAKADALKAEAEALKENQEALLAQRALEVLPDLMSNFAEGYRNVGSMTVISGSGEDSGMGNHFAGEQAAGMKAVFQTVQQTTGVDLAGIINGQATGRATGQAIGQALRENSSAAVHNAEPAQEINDTDFATEEFGTTRSSGRHSL